MEIEYISNKRKIKRVYWKNYVSLDDVIKEEKRVSEIQFCYPKHVDKRIMEAFDVVIIIEGDEFAFGGRTFSKSVDLAQSKECIFRGFKKTRRYETRRAKARDGLFVEMYYEQISDEVLSDFIEFHNTFARHRSLSLMDEEFIRALKYRNSFAIGVVRDQNDDPLVMNGYIICKTTGVVSLYSSASVLYSEDRDTQLIGRANGYLQYEMMCSFKDKSFLTYDFGGYYQGELDLKKREISNYKDSFGGEIDEFETGFVIRFDDIDNVKNNLIRLRREIENNDVIIYGASLWGRYIGKKVREICGVDPICFIDNRLESDSDKNIYNKKRLVEFDSRKTIILVSTLFENYLKICNDEYSRPWSESGRAFCVREENY